MTTTMQRWLLAAARDRAERDQVRSDRPRTAALDLASNDYLGLAGDPRLIAAANAATTRHGTGARASRVVTGTTAVHRELEHELCALTGRPAALVFSSGWTANLGVLGALGGRDVLVAQDRHAHASLIDGARLSRSEIALWPHGDLDALDDLLRRRTRPRALVVVESIYSVLGDGADLPALAALCAVRDAVLVVDEAHGIGVIGAGRGAVHAAGLADAEHVVVTATLSKALGAAGGAVLGSPLLREHLVNTARTFLFDTGLAPAPAAAAAEACRVVVAEPERVAAVGRVAAHLAAGCGIPPVPAAVQSLPVGGAAVALEAARRLEAEGVLVGCFRPPSVPDGVSRLRLTARADVPLAVARRAAEQVRATVEALRETPAGRDR